MFKVKELKIKSKYTPNIFQFPQIKRLIIRFEKIDDYNKCIKKLTGFSFRVLKIILYFDQDISYNILRTLFEKNEDLLYLNFESFTLNINIP